MLFGVHFEFVQSRRYRKSLLVSKQVWESFSEPNPVTRLILLLVLFIKCADFRHQSRKVFPMEILELKSLSRMVMPMPWCSPEITLMMKTEWLERRPVTSLVISRTNPKLAWPWQVARGPTIWNCTGLECRNPIYGKKYRKYFLVLIIHYFRTNVGYLMTLLNTIPYKRTLSSLVEAIYSANSNHDALENHGKHIWHNVLNFFLNEYFSLCPAAYEESLKLKAKFGSTQPQRTPLIPSCLIFKLCSVSHWEPKSDSRKLKFIFFRQMESISFGGSGCNNSELKSIYFCFSIILLNSTGIIRTKEFIQAHGVVRAFQKKIWVPITIALNID